MSKSVVVPNSGKRGRPRNSFTNNSTKNTDEICKASDLKRQKTEPDVNEQIYNLQHTIAAQSKDSKPKDDNLVNIAKR